MVSVGKGLIQTPLRRVSEFYLLQLWGARVCGIREREGKEESMHAADANLVCSTAQRCTLSLDYVVAKKRKREAAHSPKNARFSLQQSVAVSNPVVQTYTAAAYITLAVRRQEKCAADLDFAKLRYVRKRQHWPNQEARENCWPSKRDRQLYAYARRETWLEVDLPLQSAFCRFFG